MKVTVSVVDCTHGRPAEGIVVRLERRISGVWAEQARGQVDESGKLTWELMEFATKSIYRIEIDTDSYFAAFGIVPSHPCVTVVFRVISHDEDQQIPVLITPHSHLAYRVG
jgi:5-hydroxyisourate hydrolase